MIFGERFLYLSLLSAAWLVAAGLQYVERTRVYLGLVTATLAFAGLLGTQSYARTADLMDEASFWRAAVRVAPSSVQSRIGLATTLRKARRCDEAVAHYAFVLSRVTPSAPSARQIYGEATSCYSQVGQRAEALNTVSAWLAQHPTDKGFLVMQRQLQGPARE